MSGLEQHLARTAGSAPDQVAFRFMDQTLSYGALLSAARDLAAALVAAGVGRGDRVGIAMPKGLGMPVAVHATWMAGAAFVPLDPAAPQDRLLGFVATCDIRVIIGAPGSVPLLTALAAEVELTIFGAGIAGATCPPVPHAAEFVPAVNGPDDLAYVIFTSGSTGVPKGISHTHGSGTAFAEMWCDLYDLRAEDVLFCTVPLHFDFCLADFLAAPMRGATTVLVPEPLQVFPAEIARHLEETGATIWSTVPFALIQMIERGAPGTRDLSALRWIIYGGEPMPPAKLPGIRAHLTAQISNSYGPAEVNQISAYTVPANHPADQAVPLGHATAHAVLAEDADGTLLVAASSMMRGYWGRPDLDARVFVQRDGQRFYRTGDLVERGPDGLWRFRGRADRQVKIRGYRVELEEVEIVLSNHADVADAAVIAAPDGLSLMAVVLTAPGTDCDTEALRRHAAAQLPAYAVPATIETRTDLVRTGTGKIDRTALAEEMQ